MNTATTGAVIIRSTAVRTAAVNLLNLVSSTSMLYVRVAVYTGPSTTAVVQGRGAREGHLLHADYYNFVNFKF